MQIETVKVKADNEQGFIVINKCDLTKDHKLFKDKPLQSKTKKTEHIK